ncbi:6-hydroxymethylpterin diphosphokinase MptE-like protein [Desulfurivibrio dismutans]|uniref:6-hydroxymethylpterin diphosphokinase MptE-like protein n=1 Tax=Desulfurivibrio dismutans TaxID=1398908 RepID=UPI0023DC328E|nr:6-hydroxymethylpterin diphosphokinase MptE-like protein [Desulfurivibrio alkaliphilus]MDF1615679.1 DUF115 domain-containing protein [Desulfurivibrio alkaliphilus]
MDARLAAFNNRHIGERAFLVANGPSLNRMDLGFLRRENVIGLNKIFLGLRKFKFYPKYYVAVNEKVIQQAAGEIKKLNCVKFIGERGAAFVPEDALTYHVVTRNRQQRFYHDISEGVHEGWTVTYAALQIAYYLGFKEIIIIGLDHRYQYSGQPDEAKRLDGPDPNHFCPDYFGYGQTWDNPNLARSEESYRIARQEYEKAGRRIWDATVDGACTVFDKIDYRKFANHR